MARFVEFPLEEGGSILIEVNEEGAGRAGFVKAGEAQKDMAEPAKLSFEAAVENVRKASNVMMSKLRDLSAQPDEMQINFSLKASAELGNLALSKGGPDASYFVTLKWRREPPKSEKKEESGEAAREDKKPNSGQEVRAVASAPASVENEPELVEDDADE